MHLVETFLERSREIISVGKRHDAIGLRIPDEMQANIISHFPLFQVKRFEIHVILTIGENYRVLVSQRLIIHRHREVVYVRMFSFHIHLSLIIIGSLCLKSHFHRLGLSVVHELILYVNVRIAIIAYANGKHLLSYADIRLLQRYQLISLYKYHTIVSLNHHREQAQNCQE